MSVPAINFLSKYANKTKKDTFLLNLIESVVHKMVPCPTVNLTVETPVTSQHQTTSRVCHLIKSHFPVFRKNHSNGSLNLTAARNLFGSQNMLSNPHHSTLQ
jgi:hypothetical protein